MDFKTGDIVRIKGGVDEWEVKDIDANVYWIILGDARVAVFTSSNLEFIRRTGSYTIDEPSMKSRMEDARLRACCDLSGRAAIDAIMSCYPLEDLNKAPFPKTTPGKDAFTKKKVERWLWVYKNPNDEEYFMDCRWFTEEEAHVVPFSDGSFLVGRDPNCKEPLVTDE